MSNLPLFMLIIGFALGIAAGKYFPTEASKIKHHITAESDLIRRHFLNEISKLRSEFKNRL